MALLSCEEERNTSKKVYDIIVYDYAKVQKDCPIESDVSLMTKTLNLKENENILRYLIKRKDCLEKTVFFQEEYIFFDFNESLSEDFIFEDIKIPFVIFKDKSKIQEGSFSLKSGQDLFGHIGVQYFHWQSTTPLSKKTSNLVEIILEIDVSSFLAIWRDGSFKKNMISSFIKIGEEKSKAQSIKLLK